MDDHVAGQWLFAGIMLLQCLIYVGVCIKHWVVGLKKCPHCHFVGQSFTEHLEWDESFY
jgi:hypothetical protein